MPPRDPAMHKALVQGCAACASRSWLGSPDARCCSPPPWFSRLKQRFGSAGLARRVPSLAGGHDPEARSMPAALLSKLPLPDSFESGYLEFNGILPLELTDDHLRVAVAGEPAVEVLDDLEVSFGVALELVPVSRDELLDGIRRAYAAAESVVELVRDLDAEVGGRTEGGDATVADARDLANQPPVIRFVNLLIRE